MKIETLVDVINCERGEWRGGEGSNRIEVGKITSTTVYRNAAGGRPYSCLNWTREEFENEVAELSAAAWIKYGRKWPSYDEFITKQNSTKSGQLHQPESSGGSCSYYKCEITSPTTEPEAYTAECNDLIEALDMTYAEANIFKEIWRTCAARKGKVKEGHQSTRGAEKVLFFAVRNAIQKGADVSQIISSINKG